MASTTRVKDLSPTKEFTVWCAANHRRTLSASRSASRSTILCVSRFTRMLPKRLPRRQLQSSTPTTRTWPISGEGRRKRDQSMLTPEMGIPSLPPSCSPPFPQVANPMSCTAVRKRLVRREEAAMKSGSRSVNTDAENSQGCDKRTCGPPTPSEWDDQHKADLWGGGSQEL